MQTTLVSGIVLAVIALSLGVADYIVKERPGRIAQGEQTITETPDTAPVQEDLNASESSSSRTVVKKGQSTKKREGPNVNDVLAVQGLATQATREASILAMVIPNNPAITTVALLSQNDRAALFSWIDSPDVKDIFGGVKESIQQSFSPEVTGLIDETRTQEDGPTFDYLTFTDPAISAERVVFVRVRTRLYEFHIVKGKEELIYRLIGELTR